MTSINNIFFKKNGQTRYVKHGFSWQLAFFGPLAFFMRGQWPLALACMGFFFVCFLFVGLSISFVWEPESDWIVELFAVAIPLALIGQFGNRISARSYIKNGWLPVDAFPAEWNIPPILPLASAVNTNPTPTQRAPL